MEAKAMQPLRELDAFYRNGMPGFSLLTERPRLVPAHPESLVNRCPECGRRISANKNICRDCRETILKDIASGIQTPAALEELLSKSPDRSTLYQALRPYLSEAAMDDDEITDADLVGVPYSQAG